MVFAPASPAAHPGAPHDLAALEAAGSLLRALAAPVRLAIIMELRHGPRRVHELVSALGVSQPLISQHLRVLRGVRLVTTQRHGREITYELADVHVGHIATDAVSHAQEER